MLSPAGETQSRVTAPPEPEEPDEKSSNLNKMPPGRCPGEVFFRHVSL